MGAQIQRLYICNSFTLPTTIAPKYTPIASAVIPNLAYSPQVPYKLKLNIAVDMQSGNKIETIRSPSHDAQQLSVMKHATEEHKATVLIQRNTAIEMDKDFVLQVKLQQPHPVIQPIVEEYNGSKACAVGEKYAIMLPIVPDFHIAVDELNTEIVMLIDWSGINKNYISTWLQVPWRVNPFNKHSAQPIWCCKVCPRIFISTSSSLVPVTRNCIRQGMK